MNVWGGLVRLLAIATFVSGSLVILIDHHFIEFCSGPPYYSNLCMSAGIVYHEYNDSVESAGKITELLLGATKDHWAILAGETSRFKLDNFGTIFENSRSRTAFEGRRYVESEGAEFEMSRICRTPECKFAASDSRNSDYLGSDKQVRAAQHVRSFAFADRTADVIPVVDIPGPHEVAQAYYTPGKLVVVGVVLVSALILRTEKEAGDIDSSQTVSNELA